MEGKAIKILSIGNFLNPSWDGSLPDEEHIAGALEDLGHEVHRLQREEIQNAKPVHEIFPGHGYDFILLAQYDGYPASMIPWIRKDKCPIVYWAFDYQADGQEWHERLIVESDLYLSKRIADSKYPNWQYLSQDFAPEFLTTGPDVERDIDVLFTGSYLPWATERIETLKAIDEKYNLVIHSVNEWPGFKDVRPPVMDDGLIDLYQRSKVNISIDHTLEAGYWSDRNAQIMACAGFVLCRYIPLMETRFHNRIRYFYNIEDCLSKINYWLRHDSERQFIANEGWGLDEFKVKSKVSDLLTIVNSIL